MPSKQVLRKRIMNNKLCLNVSPGVQKLWEKDFSDYIEAADKNWPGVLT